MASLGRGPQFLLVLIGSAGLAALLDLARFPAALLLGPMLAAIGCALMGGTIRLPRRALLGAQSVVGCLVAQALTPSILHTLAADWAPMLLIVMVTVLAGAVIGWTLTRLQVLSGATAAWGSSPGGAAAMVAMAEEFGADPRLVAVMQYLRVVLVVLSATLVSRLLLGAHPAAPPAAAVPLLPPFLPFVETLAIAAVGGWAGWRFRVPGGPLLVPAIGGALLHGFGLAEIALPVWLLAGAYAAIGWYIGLAFDRASLLYALKALPRLLVAVAGLIALCAGAAWLLTRLMQVDLLTAYLATSPGGLDSMTIIAIGSRADVPFVLALHAVRLVLVLGTGPALAKAISRYA